MSDSTLLQSVNSFIAHEAHLLNHNEFQPWLNLFDKDGIYWMPADTNQTDPLQHVSHMYENASLRELRVRRFNEKIALSLEPQVRTVRHNSNLLVEQDDKSGLIMARASVLMAQYAYGSIQEFHAYVNWQLMPKEGSFSIVLKRVDLLNSDGYLSDILTYI